MDSSLDRIIARKVRKSKKLQKELPPGNRRKFFLCVWGLIFGGGLGIIQKGELLRTTVSPLSFAEKNNRALCQSWRLFFMVALCYEVDQHYY